MAKAVNCPCGETIKADTDDELVHWYKLMVKRCTIKRSAEKTPWRWLSR